jgi:hypothetical protein
MLAGYLERGQDLRLTEPEFAQGARGGAEDHRIGVAEHVDERRQRGPRVLAAAGEPLGCAECRPAFLAAQGIQENW